MCVCVCVFVDLFKRFFRTFDLTSSNLTINVKLPTSILAFSCQKALLHKIIRNNLQIDRHRGYSNSCNDIYAVNVCMVTKTGNISSFCGFLLPVFCAPKDVFMKKTWCNLFSIFVFFVNVLSLNGTN